MSRLTWLICTGFYLVNSETAIQSRADQRLTVIVPFKRRHFANVNLKRRVPKVEICLRDYCNGQPWILQQFDIRPLFYSTYDTVREEEEDCEP